MSSKPKLMIVPVTGLILMLTASPVASGATTNTRESDSASRSQMKLNIIVAGNTLTATLVDNATTRDFIKLLPLNLSMGDLFGREKFSKLPKALSDGPRTRRYKVGDIAYWSPSGDLATYYKQAGDAIPSPRIIVIGKVASGIESFAVAGSVRVTIELAK